SRRTPPADRDVLRFGGLDGTGLPARLGGFARGDRRVPEVRCRRDRPIRWICREISGDGVLAYFGYPQAHEDAAERAVRASLAAVKEVRRVASAQALQVRIGLATGVAVVGDLIGSGAAQEQAVIGDTPNLAARPQALAGPDEILIPENTRRLVGSLFEYDGLGLVEIRGLAAPVAAFRVLRESQPGSRFEALRTGETPLVGRAEELELLHR